MKILHDKTVLIISPEPWQHNFVSKHHYAYELTKFNNKVYFLNPPSLKKNIQKIDAENIWLIDYKPLLQGVNRIPWTLSRVLIEREVKKLMKQIGVSFDIVWSFDPFRFQDLRHFQAEYSIYYAADLHKNFARQNKIADSADIVLAPSEAILNNIVTATPKTKISHGVADYFFDNQSPLSLPGNGKSKVVYVGNLKSKFLNFELLERVIRGNPTSDFIFAGDATGFPDSIRLTNVILLGAIPNKAVPSLLSAADVLWLCYDTEKFPIGASNSHKIMEYLSAGKVIVSTRIQEYVNSNFLLMPEKNDDLVNLMASVIERVDYFNQLHFQTERIKYAKQFAYKNLLSIVDNILGDKISKRV